MIEGTSPRDPLHSLTNPGEERVESELDKRIIRASAACAPSRTSPVSVTQIFKSRVIKPKLTAVDFMHVARIDLRAVALPEGEGLGYKSANLRQLELLAESLGAVIPSIHPLSHHELMGHILSDYPSFLTDYAAFIDSLGNPPTLSKDNKMLLQHIQTRIVKAFSEEHIFMNDGLRDWVATRSSDYIAVRSTGMEDSDVISNAGGNYSNPFVPKEFMMISKNIGDVIASYFGEKSISQRIASDDESLILDRNPFVPVLLQESIMEKIGAETPDDQIPRSGVLFATDSMVEASVGLGHNEGVVTSEVQTDTYRFTTSGTVARSIHDKLTRFRPGLLDIDDKEVDCKAITNNPRISKEAALSFDIARRLQRIGESIHTFYGKPMDVEFTIIGDTIYLLQARPLHRPLPPEPPSYLTEDKDSIQGEILTDGGSYVRTIENSENIIVCNTIEDAYQIYKGYKKERRLQIQAIVIKESAPRTSHQAVFFTGRGLPVFVTDVAINILPPYFLDTQQGIISKEGIKQKGYICHPTPLEYSMRSTDLTECMHKQLFAPSILNNEAILKGLVNLKKRVGESLGPVITNREELTLCLEKIKKGSTDEAQVAASQIVQLIYRKTTESGITPKSRIELILILENLLDILKSESLNSLPMSLERLYSERLIEACIFQTGKGIIGGFSLLRSLSDISSHRKGSTELQRPNTEKTLGDIPFLRMERMFLQDDVKLAWKELLSHLEAVPETDREVVKVLFHKAELINGTTQFVNVILLGLLKKHDLTTDPGNVINIEAFFSELKALSVTLDPVFDRALDMHRFVHETRSSMSVWSNPDQVRKGLLGLRNRLSTMGLLHGEGSIKEIFAGLAPEGKLLLTQAIREVVTCYDELIKTCTASKLYRSNSEHVKNFLKLLQPYHEMQELIFKLTDAKHTRKYDAASYYLPESLDGITEEDSLIQMERSLGFDVTKVVESERVRYTRGHLVKATTLEDKFTLLHQTMERDLALITSKYGFSLEVLPTEFQDYISVFSDGDYLVMKKLTGITIKEPLIEVEFSVPLRDHAAKLTFRYNKKERKVAIELSFYGGNERSRWDSLKDVASDFSPHSIYKLQSYQIGPSGVSIVFEGIPMDAESLATPNLSISGLLQCSFMDQSRIPSVLRLFPLTDQTGTLVRDEIEKRPLALQYVRPDLLNEDLCLAAVAKDPYALEFVPQDLQTRPMVELALQKEPYIRMYIRPDLLSGE